MKGGGSNEPTQAPCKEDALLVGHPNESWPESIPHSPSKQHELVDPGPIWLTSPDSADEGLQANDDMPVPLRHSSRTMRNWPQWRYQNVTLWQNNILPSAFNMWVGLCICLHIMSCLYTIFVGNTVWRHSIQAITGLPDTIFGIDGDTIDVDFMVEIWKGEWTKGYLVWMQLPHLENQRKTPCRYKIALEKKPTWHTISMEVAPLWFIKRLTTWFLFLYVLVYEWHNSFFKH